MDRQVNIEIVIYIMVFLQMNTMKVMMTMITMKMTRKTTLLLFTLTQLKTHSISSLKKPLLDPLPDPQQDAPPDPPQGDLLPEDPLPEDQGLLPDLFSVLLVKNLGQPLKEQQQYPHQLLNLSPLALKISVPLPEFLQGKK